MAYYPFTVTYIDDDGVHKNAMYPGSSKPKTPKIRLAPDTDPGMYISRAVSTAPQAAIGGAKNLIWDLISLPMLLEYVGAQGLSLLENTDTPFLQDIGKWGAKQADYVEGGLDLWDKWGEDVNDALFGDRKVDAQGNEYRDGYNADGSMPVAQYALKGLGSALNVPVAFAQSARGYNPIQPMVDVWYPVSPEVRRAMYTPTVSPEKRKGISTAELDYSDPVGTYNAFVKEASMDPRVATMSLSRLGSDLLSDALALESLGAGAVKGAVKGAKLGTKATKAVAKDIKDGFKTDYRDRSIWGDVMSNALTGTTAVPKNIQVPKGNLNTFKPVPKTTMSNARLREYNLRGR